MSTLANTNWTMNSDVGGTITLAFGTDNTVSMTHPNKQVFTQYWAEAVDGTFAIECPKSTINPNINEVFAGKHLNGTGSGYLFLFGIPGTKTSAFTMTKNNTK